MKEVAVVSARRHVPIGGADKINAFRQEFDRSILATGAFSSVHGLFSASF